MDLSFLCLLLLLNSLVQSKHSLTSNALGDVVGVLCHHGIPGIRIVRRKIAGFKAPVAVSELIVANKVLRRGKSVSGPELLVLAEHDFVPKEGSSAELVFGPKIVVGTKSIIESKLVCSADRHTAAKFNLTSELIVLSDDSAVLESGASPDGLEAAVEKLAVAAPVGALSAQRSGLVLG